MMTTPAALRFRVLFCSRKSADRRKRRLAEEEEDEIDRQREAREAERRAKRAAAAGEASAQEGTPGPAGSTVYDSTQPPAAQTPSGAAAAANGASHGHGLQQQPAVKVEPKVEPEVDTNDPIYQAMLAAARAPPPTHQPSPVAKAEEARPADPHGQQRPHGARFRSESPPPPHQQQQGPGSAGAAASGGGGGGGGRMAFGAGARGRNNAAVAAMFADEEETTQKRQLVRLAAQGRDECGAVGSGVHCTKGQNYRPCRTH